MSWASHPTTEMPTNPQLPTGRHRANRRRLIALLAALSVVIIAAAAVFLSGLLNSPGSGPALAESATTEPAPASGITGDGLATDDVSAGPSTVVGPIAPGTVSVASSPAQEADVFALTNAERVTLGCAPLRLDDSLAAAARSHSVEMAGTGTFQHNGLDGTDPGQRMQAAGYDVSGTGWAENIARGQPTPAAVLAAWMGSPGHRANIVNCEHKAIGVGVARASTGQLYWTQDFGGR